MREMKDSGIEWIGEIPKDWEIIKGKYVLEYLQKPVKDDDGVITCFRDGEVTLRSNRREDGFTLSDKEIGYQGIDVGDLVVHGMDGFAGAIGISDSRGKASPVLNVLNSKYNKRYLMYYLRSMAFSNVFVALASGIRVRSCDLRWNKLAELPYPTTSYDEQTEIVSYLDTQCSEIDATVEDIQKEITLLEDYKKSVITEAVTKGLNPDAEMKDSKIFYLGKINKTWNLTKVGYCCKKLYRPFEPSDEALVCSNKGKVVPRGDTLIGLMTSDDNAMQGICKGDIAIHGMDTWHGAIACSDYDGKITRVVHVCKADGDNRFVVYWLQHLAFVGVYKLISNGVRGNTSDFRSWDKVADIYVPNPIKEEQQQIADFLDTKCSEIDSLIADKKRQLDILADYKKSLIYEYVTGKKEVPVNE